MGDVIELKPGVKSESGVQAYALGDIAPALESTLPDFLETLLFNGEWFEPPVSFEGLTKLLRANATHESAVFCKKTTVMRGYKPGPVQVISRRDMGAVTLDFVYLGNAFLQRIADRTGRVMELRHLIARSMRRGSKEGEFFQINGTEKVKFKPGEIIHISAYGPETSIYGVPEYLGAINSILLNEAAGLFRRRYFKNGAHAGFILASTGDGMDEGDVTIIKDALKKTQGDGNFKSLYLHFPMKDGKTEILRVGEFTKDDFEKVKKISRDEIITAHRVPPEVLAVVMDGEIKVSGDLDKIVKLYSQNVAEPIQLDLKEPINENLEQDQWIDFAPYTLGGETSQA